MARRYAKLSHERPFVLLLIFAALSAGSVLAAKYGMDIRTDLESLLPQGTASVAALEESRQRKGSTDSYTIAVNSPDTEANVKLIKALAEEVSKWEETQWVQVDRDNAFFADHALLYLPLKDLENLRDNLKGEVKKEKKLNNPFFVDIRNKEEIKADNKKRWAMDRWLAPDLSWRLGLEKDLFDSIISADKLGLGEEEKEGAEGVEAVAATKPPEEAAVPPHLKKYLLSPDGTVAVLLASLSQPATDVVKSRELMERGQSLIESVNPTSFHPEMKAKVAGAYRNFKEVESISHDSTIATIASVVLVLIVLLVFFRNLRSVILLIVPLSMGVIWSLGLTALTYGRLNISTLFVFSMLIGMGIDFGIHFYARILEEFRGGKPMEEAIAQSMVHTGRSMLSAAVTTIAALLTLVAAHFQGFVEFGVIASYGIALCLASAVLVMPAVIFALEKIWATKRPEGASDSAGMTPLSSAGLRKARVAGIVCIAIGLAGGAFAVVERDGASFEHDFRNLRGKKAPTGIRYGSAVGRKKSTSPAMILGNSAEQMRDVHEVLAKKFLETEGGKGSYLKSFVTLQTYVPPNQDARMAVIKEIKGLVDDKKLNRSKGRAKTFIDRMRKLSAVEAFTIDKIPEWARRSILEKDGTIGHIGYLYSNVKKWDASDVAAFQKELGLIETRTGKVSIASSGFIVADVVRTVKEDAFRLMPIVFGVLLIILLLDLRSIKGTIICLISMGFALLWTVGAMIIFDLRLGLYNMIVLPMILGTGIDGSIHLYHRFNELGAENIGGVLKTTGASVVASSMTTLAGFSGLLFVEHLGVKSIGTLAVAGIISTLIAVFAFMPGLMLLLMSKDSKKAES